LTRIKRVNGGELARVGTFAAKAVECADNFQRRLRYGLFKVTARRAYRAADCYGAEASVAQAHNTRSFVEVCDCRFHVSGEGFFARDFFQAA